MQDHSLKYTIHYKVEKNYYRILSILQIIDINYYMLILDTN